jgi:hypothetical protein
LDRLYKIIDDACITLVEDDIPGKVKGLYFDNIIVLHKKINLEAEKKCILAEEIGHHFTASNIIIDKSKLNNEKQEEAARRWASKLLFEPIRLIDAFNAGVSNRWELSQYLDLTEDFIEESIKHFKKFYGEYITINEYTVHFDPLWIYKSFD